MRKKATMDLTTKPNIILDTSFANQLSLASVAGLSRMIEEGTLPEPGLRRGDKPVWFETEVVDFFGQLQPEQSAYAPIDQDLGRTELEQLEAYVCPAGSSGHIGNRRPSFLALYKAGEARNDAGLYELSVFPVLWVQTQLGVAGETVAAPVGVDGSSVAQVPWSSVRPDVNYPLTLFKLDLAGERTLLAPTGIRRGGTISTESLEAALADPAQRPVRFKDGIVHLLD